MRKKFMAYKAKVDVAAKLKVNEKVTQRLLKNRVFASICGYGINTLTPFAQTRIRHKALRSAQYLFRFSLIFSCFPSGMLRQRADSMQN